ncbi:WD40 repeat-like protein [Sistotremastrum niveocremeum HHB9708]|uniref:WD40 repeat-like protein n=1 Tax=Sistotremastrum niveocremeum HHB9708 TaxID=1314777 RepID=A0A164MBJ1_9AGAM|nr:WD40 repeat-like protein [Sistotremastrum niveocremeum HHB9708]
MLELTHLLQTELRGPNCVSFAEDGRLIAVGADDGTILLWRPAMDAVFEIQVGAPVVCLAAVPILAGHFSFVCGLGDGLLLEILLDSSKDTIIGIKEMIAHTSPVTAILYSPKLNIMLSAGQTDGIKSWKRDSHEKWCKRGDLVDKSSRASEPIQSMSLTNEDNGLIITYVGGTTLVLDLSNGAVLRRIESSVPIAASAVDASKSLFATLTFRGRLEVQSLFSNFLHANIQLPVGRYISASAVSFISPTMLVSASPEGNAILWKFLEDHCKPEVLDHGGSVVRSMQVRAAEVSPTHQLLLVSLSRNKNGISSLRLWTWNGGAPSIQRTKIQTHKSGLIASQTENRILKLKKRPTMAILYGA